MIRTKDKIYGEVNDDRTVISKSKLKPNKYIIKSDEPTMRYKIIEEANFGSKKLLYTKKNTKGEVEVKTLDYNVPNMYVGTDSEGNLKMRTVIMVDTEAPAGRKLLKEYKGSIIPSQPITVINHVIEEPGWYEIEVSGAGGGGGGSVLHNQYETYNAKGSNGGAGGYHKQLIRLTKPNTVILIQPGNSGGGAEGYKISTMGALIHFDGRTNGGDGGRNIVFTNYNIKGNNGEDVQRGIQAPPYSKYKLKGGVGTHGGPDGGYSSIETGNFNAGPGGGGGGGVGPYGGAGGSCNSVALYGHEFHGAGGAGGAGGSFGIGGNGGRRDSRDRYGGHGYGYGGAGGGCGFNSTDSVNSVNEDILKGSPYSGAGGGGGGGTRVYIASLNLEILAGGGGGGAGGALSFKSGLITDGGNGITNMSDLPSIKAAKGGSGGQAVLDTTIKKGFNVDMSGKNGEPGYVRIYKCI